MKDTYEAVVVGGGIVGSSTAYHLARADVETLLIDRSDDGRATDAGAGIISPATSSRTADDAWFAFASDAVAYYPTLNDQLEAAGVTETSYARQGALAVATHEDEFELYDDALERIDDRELDAVEEIDSAEAVERFPALERPKRAFHVPDAARVDGRTFTESILEAAQTHELETTNGEVTSLLVDDGRVSGAETAAGRRIGAKHVVISGGAWSPAFADELGVTIPVEPHRGQVAHLSVPAANTSSWPIVSGFRHHYLVPWPNGKIVLGATREPMAGFDPRLTAGGVADVLTEGLRVAPGLADATLEELRAGLRPVSVDRMPILGAVPELEGVYLATGHGATGLMLGPYSGKIITERVLGDATAVPDRFTVSRFD